MGVGTMRQLWTMVLAAFLFGLAAGCADKDPEPPKYEGRKGRMPPKPGSR